MSRSWTVQVGCNAHHCNTVTVEAGTVGQALEKAIAAAGENPAGWRSTGHCSEFFVDAVCEGAGADPWGEGALPVPDCFAEAGEPPLVTVSLDSAGKPAVRVEGGKARILDG